MTASDKSKIGSIAGAVGISGSTAVGGSLAVNFIGGFSEDVLGPHQIRAFITNSEVVSTNGSIELKALSESIIKSIAAAGNFAGSVAVNGSVSINWIYTDVAAYIHSCQLIQAEQDIILDAVDNSAVSVIAGDVSGGGTVGVGAAIAIVFIGGGTDSLKEWFDDLFKNELFADGEYPYGDLYDEDYVDDHKDENWEGQEGVSEEDYQYPEPEFADTGKVRAYISDSNVIAENGSVKVTATNNSIIFTISAGFAVGGKGGAYRGSLSLNYIHNDVLALIIDSIIQAGDDVRVMALTLERNWIPKGALEVEWDDEKDYDPVTSFEGGQEYEPGENHVETDPTSPKRLTSIQAIAGGVSGGLTVGLGAALAVNHLLNEYSAAIVNSTITAGGDVIILAECNAGIETVSGAIALALGDNSFPFAAAGSLSLNMINNTVLSHITASVVEAENITILAKDTSFINSVSGQVGISGGIIAGPVPIPTGASFGAALAYNDINSVVKAYTDDVLGEEINKDSDITTRGNIVIQALFDADINTIVAGGSLSVWVGASGTVATNVIKSWIEAYIAGSNVVANNNIYILAHSDSSIGSYGGAVGGGLIGYGAAAVINVIDGTTKAYISNSDVVARGKGEGIEVLAWDEKGKPVKEQGKNPKEKGLIIIAYSRDALTVFTGSIGVGAVGLSGELSANSLKNLTEAYITSSNINSDDDWGKNVIIRACQDTGVVIHTGVVSVGVGGIALGTTLNTILVQGWTRAYIDDASTVYALEGIEIWALTGYHTIEEGKKVIIGGVSVGTVSTLAGAVSVLLMENINEAYVKESDLFSQGTITVKSLHNVKFESTIANVAADLVFMGAGGSIFFTSLENIVLAYVEDSRLNASGTIEIAARSRDDIDLVIGTGGVGSSGGIAGSIGLTLIETITEAYLQGEVNQDPRFRPGGLYQPGDDKQSVLVWADNETKVKTVGGTVGAGLGFGAGAGFDMISIHNRTVAMIKKATEIYARDDIEVKAKSLKEVDSQVYAIEAGGLAGISGAVSIIIVGTAIDEDGEEQINSDLQNQVYNDLSKDTFFYYNKDGDSRMPSIFGDRLITLLSFFNDMGKIAKKVKDAFDPSMEHSDRVTMAAVEKGQKQDEGVQIVTDGKVIIKAINDNNIKTSPSNVAATGLVGFGGTVVYVFTQERTLAYVGDYANIRALSLDIRAESRDKVEVLCRAVSGTLGIGAHAYVAWANVTPHLDAYLENNVNVIVSKSVEINAEVIPEVVTEVKNVDIGGAGQIGASIAEATVVPVVNAWIGDNTYIFAATLPVTGNPTLTLLDKAELTGNPDLQFRGYTIKIEGEFEFVRGVAMSTTNGSELEFEGPAVVGGKYTLIRGVALTGQPGLEFEYGTVSFYAYITLTPLADLGEGYYKLEAWESINGEEGYPLNEIIKVGDYLTIIEYSNTQFWVLSVDGNTAVLVTDEQISPTTGRAGCYIDRTRNSITRSEGSWRDDGFKPGDTIIIRGTAKNNNTYKVKFISEDGSVLVIENDRKLMNENIEAGTEVSIVRGLVMTRYDTLIFEHNEYWKDVRKVTFKQTEAGYGILEVEIDYYNDNLYLQLLIGDYISIWKYENNQQLTGKYQVIDYSRIQGSLWYPTKYTIIVATQDDLFSHGEYTYVSLKGERSTITHSGGYDAGNWRDDGFQAGDIIVVEGAGDNDGQYIIIDISDDGKTIFLDPSANIINRIYYYYNPVTIYANRGYDRLKRIDAPQGWSWQHEKIKPGDRIILTVEGEEGKAYSGEHGIIAVLLDGTLILDTSGRFTNLPVLENVDATVIQDIPSTITRNDGGSWIADGFEIGDTIVVSGTRYNDGKYMIVGISDDGRVLILSDEVLLVDEIISAENSESIVKELEGQFTLEEETETITDADGNETTRTKIVLKRTGIEDWSWEDLNLLLGDYVLIHVLLEPESDDDEYREDVLRCEIIEINDDQITINLSGFDIGDLKEGHIDKIELEFVPNTNVVIRADGIKGHDKLIYKGSGDGWGTKNSRGDEIEEGDFITVITPGSGDQIFGANSGIYQIVDFIEIDGNIVAVLDTFGLVTPGTMQNVEVSKIISSEISRSKGDWITDGFAPGQLIYIEGAENEANNGYFYILDISGDGKILKLYRGQELADEDISASEISISAVIPDRIIRDHGSWEDDGFEPGQKIRISGSKKGNDGIYIVTEITADGRALVLDIDGVFTWEEISDLIIMLVDKHESNIIVNARVSLPESQKTATAKASGINGSAIFSGSGVMANAKINPVVNAYIGQASELEVDGIIEILAEVNTSAEAYTDTINAAGVSLSDNSAYASADSKISAHVGDNSGIKAYQLFIKAIGEESTYAEASTGEGGLVSGSLTEAKTNNVSNTTASVGGARIEVNGFELFAEHTAVYNSKVDTFRASLVGGSAGKAYNYVNAVLKAQIGSNAVINANDILVRANNYTVKEELKEGHNVNAGSGGGIDIPAATSETKINQEAIIEILNNATLNLVSNPLIYPGNLNLSAYNYLLAKDSVKLHSISGITAATAKSLITATDKSQVIIGEDANLNSEEDINISAHSKVEIVTDADIYVKGAVELTSSDSSAEVTNENSIKVMPHALLFAKGTINLLVGKDIFDNENNIRLSENSYIENYGAVPVTNPKADGMIYLNNYITIEGNANLKSVGDINLITESGVLLAHADVRGTDWTKSILGADILNEGTARFEIDSVITVNGTVMAGIDSQQILIIGENGQAQEKSEGITISYRKDILHNYILQEIRTLSWLAAEYAGTEAGEAFKAQIRFLERELELLGYKAGSEPLAPIWIDIIAVGNIRAEQANINIVSEDGSLVGNGMLNASSSPALIQIINHSKYYLELGSLIIPEKQGGLIYFNYSRVKSNEEINELNKDNEANLSIVSGETTDAPRIEVRNTYVSSDGRNPDIRIMGSISNIGYTGKPGIVEIESTGNISVYGSIEAGDLSIDAGGNFSQSYTDSFFNVGGSPRAIWSGLVGKIHGRTIGYPYYPTWVLEDNGVIKLVWKRDTKYDSDINSILNSSSQSSIKADNIFIAARYLNINGLIEAGRSEYKITFGNDVANRINQYKQRGLSSQNYKNYPLFSGQTDYYYYYDPVNDAIVLEPISVRGGYIELFGHIINTGKNNGIIRALDGYGIIDIQNNTDYAVIIKGLDTGIGSKGVVIITDTSKYIQQGGKTYYQTTRYESEGDQVKITTWYTDDKGNKLNESSNNVNKNQAYYNPTEGWRYEWVMGQSITEKRIETYCSKTWLGMDWIARDPDDLIELTYIPIGQPRLLPDGEYLSYRPSDANESYIYKYEYKVLDSIYWDKPKASEYWTEQSWFLAPKYYYSKFYFERGTMEVYYHSIKADYPIKIEFSGSAQNGEVTVNSPNGSIIIDGPIKNANGTTKLITNKSIAYRTASPILSNVIILQAGTGIGVNNPVHIELHGNGRRIDASTTTGDISIKEINDTLYVGSIISENGNVRLEAQTRIIGYDSNSLVTGKLIELYTFGDIGSESLPFRINSGTEVGEGVSALASGNIYLHEISGSLPVINVTSRSGDIHIKVANGGLVDGNPDDYQGNNDLLSLWNDWIKDENTAREIYEFLEAVRIKILSSTNYWNNDLDLAGNNIVLDVAADIGATGQYRIDLTGGKVSLTNEMRTILAGAKPGEVAFYDSSGRLVTDPEQLDSQVAYLLVTVYRPLTVQADKLNAKAGGHIFLNSKEDLNVNTVQSTTGKTIMLKSARGIYSVRGLGDGANIIGGDLVLEAATGPLGTADTPLLLQPGANAVLTARSGSDIYLECIKSDGSRADINIDFIYTPGLVNFVAGSIQAASDDENANIVSGALILTASSIGAADNYLRIDLLANGCLTASATGDIYLQEVAGDMKVVTVISNSGSINLKSVGSIILGIISSESGDIYLHAQDSISTDVADDNPNIKGKGLIQLIAINGEIGSLDNFLRVYTMPGGRLNATAKGNIHINGVGGHLYLDTLTSQSEEGVVYIITPYSVLNGNPDPNEVNIESNKAHIEAGGDIGTEDKYLITVVDYLEGISVGDIRIYNVRDLIVGNVAEETTGLTSGGLLHLIVTGKLVIAENIISHDDLILSTQDLATEGQDIIVNNGVTLESKTASLELQAGDNILLPANAILKAFVQVILRVDDQQENPVSG
ncbi:MAG: hypothetical protein GX076_10295, partial [Clostridiales bacterium]|nr:hypothetical protein [Clostridiales bacterium]